MWMSERARSAIDIRSIADAASSQAVRAALEVSPAWPTALQDAYMDAILGKCKGAAWASDPSQSLGLFCPARMASLNLLAMLQAQGSGLQNAEQELASTLSPDEFRTFRDALVATGRTFRDLVKVGSVWSLSAGAAASAVAPSVVGVGSTGSDPSTGLSAFSASTGGSGHGAGSAVGTNVPLEEEELQLHTLRVNIQMLLSAAEITFFRGKAKYSTPSAGFKRERAHPGDADETDSDAAAPVAAYPWNQSLLVQDSYSLSMLGRMLRVALT